MKIIRFLGGLGNQMFQYAFYKAMKKKYTNVSVDLASYKTDRSHNGYELEKLFDLTLKKTNSFSAGIYNIENQKKLHKTIRNIFNLRKYYEEEKKYYSFDPNVFADNKKRYYYGFWQNQQYFLTSEKEIRKDFTFKPPTDPKNISILDKINYTNSISIHIRRGDYVNHPSFGGICEQEYYQKAIRYIKDCIENPSYFIFSNDIDWCIENLHMEDAEFISWNTGKSSYIDMQLMSSCKHNIIANSSFSWWAAWLNNHSDKIVIGPERWLQDEEFDTSTLMPTSWIRL